MSGGKNAPVRASPARVEDAGPASGPPGSLTKPRKLSECLLAQRVISGGETPVWIFRLRVLHKIDSIVML